MLNIELVIRFIIEFFWIYACIYAIQSTKLLYWKQCWYVILVGTIIHTAYILTAFFGIFDAGILRNIGMGIVGIGIIMLARRTKDILG
ncbi:MAG: hypothetical protein KAR85_04950 [Methanosarcinales archaeon]|nr:hypothetical protein [Methanosarcinales archaeon]